MRMLPWTRENPIGPRLKCTTIVLHFPRRDSSRAGAIATRIDIWSDFDGPSANRLMCLRAERCANGPPLLLIPLSALPGLERTMGLIHPYPTPVATGSRLYMVHRSGIADALHEIATLQLYLVYYAC